MVANQSQMMNESKGGDMEGGYQGMSEEQQMQQSDL